MANIFDELSQMQSRVATLSADEFMAFTLKLWNSVFRQRPLLKPLREHAQSDPRRVMQASAKLRSAQTVANEGLVARSAMHRSIDVTAPAAAKRHIRTTATERAGNV